MRLRLFLPLIGYVVPTALIGYGLVLPRNGHAGMNEISIGFASAILGACVTYVVGIAAALRTARDGG